MKQKKLLIATLIGAVAIGTLLTPTVASAQRVSSQSVVATNKTKEIPKITSTLSKPFAEYGTNHGTLQLKVDSTKISTGTITVFKNNKVIYNKKLIKPVTKGSIISVINLGNGGEAGYNIYSITYGGKKVGEILQQTLKAKVQINAFKQASMKGQKTTQVKAQVHTRAKHAATPTGKAKLIVNNKLVAETLVKAGKMDFKVETKVFNQPINDVTIRYEGDRNHSDSVYDYFIKK